jgi:hypothetical protein
MREYEEKNRNKELAKAYVPFQIMNQVYTQKEALSRGTLFPELDMPYIKKERDRSGGRYYD